MHELAEFLEIKPEKPCKTRKHLTFNYAPKRIMKPKTQEKWNNWFKYVQLAVFIHNTFQHIPIGCRPTLLFHGREPPKSFEDSFQQHFS